MRKRDFLFWFVFLYVLASYCSNYAHSAQPVELRAVCEIVEPGGQGSGTLVDVNDTKGLILTVRHVAHKKGNPAKFLWLNAGGQITRGWTLEVLPDSTNIQWETDLALEVCAKPKGVTPATIGTFDQDNGPWHMVGFVSGRINVVTSRRCAYNNGVLIFDEMPIPGMSGGPVFDHSGRLVGVVAAYCPAGNIGVAVDGPNLRKILEKYGL